MYPKLLKPLFDISLAIIVLIFVAPVFVLVIIALAFANQGKIFFLQNRPGKNNKIFKIIKLKTMNDLKDDNGELLPDELRLTKIGKFIRSTSLDEIPQLINVLKGDMSFVGPRPLLIEYVPLYNETQKRRHDVKPGITGWAQINGRNAISWEQKFMYDVWYVDNISFVLDIKILLHTIKKTLQSDGINNASSVTMPRFAGNK